MLDIYKFFHFTEDTNIFHLVSTKLKKHPYSFSQALHTGEDKKSIVINRQTLTKEFHSDIPLHFIVANQTHSDNIYIITQKTTKGWNSLDNTIQDCDALITNVPNVVLCILTADCVPILLYDRKNNVIAAVHAGWKGTKAQIVSKTIKKMQALYASDVDEIIAGIAPSIGKCCYQVGEDVAKYFFDTPQSYKKVNHKYMLDLPYINKEQLLRCGIKESHIEMSNICTSCKVERFFSFRKEKGCSGRFMSMIVLKDKNEN